MMALMHSSWKVTLSGFCLLLGWGLAQVAVPRFVEETETSGINSRYDGDYVVGGGVAAFDCNDDGLPDLLLSGGDNKAKFYRNVSRVGGALEFREQTSGLELPQVSGAYPIDLDGDGITDLVLLRAGEDLLMRGLGGCRFQPANKAWGFQSNKNWSTALSATWERGQSWPTLAIGTYVQRDSAFPWGSCTDNLLYRPSSSGQGFAPPIPLRPSYCSLSMLFSDWNRSGIPSLRISNDREYYRGGQEQLWQITPGQPPRLYSESEGWKRLQIWGMGIASYDLSGNGYPVYFLSSMGDNKLQALQDGSQGPTYRDLAFKLGATAHRPYTGGDVHISTAWHAQFEDFNNDGWIDLFIAKGNVGFMKDAATKDPNNLLLGKPDGSFQEAGDKAGLASFLRGRGAALVDLNGDGLLDVVVVNRMDKAQLWRNVGAGSAESPKAMGHWLAVRPQQPGPNRDAIGGWLEVQLGDRVLRRELTIGGGHASGSLGFTHFGLGDMASAKVRILWPDGVWSDWQTTPADQYLWLTRSQGILPAKIGTPSK
ncbi:Repeat domain in Vibrio, Colwellia, Bradyrhizobium and Shewanella [Meiothermus granaticius NBRC 107808]|uniref:Repeat domain in Vibrio, Colwellia, Bradyrhizobium and Shewanella n=2 Tax=Meiothermus TaxID=65551 RepID=A0A399F6D6_9DEIN|nr:Repeat domain in Vibrio, Colwellia, Bradyrhizobium and Shewanella [Meiothermus granaticius NBRC 107808]